MRRAASRALDGLGLALLALYLAAASCLALGRAAREALLLVSTRHETLAAARQRMFGPAFAAALERLRAELPEDQPYLLVEGGSPSAGGAFWVRYELAPRPAVFLGDLDSLTSGQALRKRLGMNLHQVVVSHAPGQPPELLPRYLFLRQIEQRAESSVEPSTESPAKPSAAPLTASPPHAR